MTGPLAQYPSALSVEIMLEEFGTHSKEQFDWNVDAMVSQNALEAGVLGNGICNISAKLTDFKVEHANFREGVIATVSNTYCRQRQLICSLSHALFGHPGETLLNISNFINHNRLKIYTTEANSSLFDHLKAVIHPELFFYSEYFGDQYVRGQVINGIRHEDLQDLSWDNDFFDIVLSADVMEHIADAPKAEREIVRVLKPNGIYCFTIPFHPTHNEDDIRAIMNGDGVVVHLKEPIYHHDPIRPEGILVFRIFTHAGLKSRFERLDCIYHTIRVWSRDLGLLGNNGFVMWAMKSS